MSTAENIPKCPECGANTGSEEHHQIHLQEKWRSSEILGLLVVASLQWHSRRPPGRANGIPGNQATKDARMRAHVSSSTSSGRAPPVQSQRLPLARI